jgi:hypothetical protein
MRSLGVQKKCGLTSVIKSTILIGFIVCVLRGKKKLKLEYFGTPSPANGNDHDKIIVALLVMQFPLSTFQLSVALLGVIHDASQAFTPRQGGNQPFEVQGSHRNIIFPAGRQAGATRVFSVGSNDEAEKSTPKTSRVEEELDCLQQQLSLIEALEARNEAQFDSFIDKEDQWNSLEEEEKILLESKESIVQEMEILTEQLIQLWMGQKSMDG